MSICGELVVEQRLGRAREEDEERLWRAAAAGEHAAFETLISRHRRQVASVAARFLTSREDVEDAVQETFLRAYRQLFRFRGECGIRAWLVAIVVNVCRNKRRGFWRWRELLGRHAPSLAPAPDDPRSEAESRLARGELEHAVNELPETLRLPFILRFYEELSGAEIAAALGWNESTVWSRIYAAQRALRRKLEGPDRHAP